MAARSHGRKPLQSVGTLISKPADPASFCGAGHKDRSLALFFAQCCVNELTLNVNMTNPAIVKNEELKIKWTATNGTTVTNTYLLPDLQQLPSGNQGPAQLLGRGPDVTYVPECASVEIYAQPTLDNAVKTWRTQMLWSQSDLVDPVWTTKYALADSYGNGQYTLLVPVCSAPWYKGCEVEVSPSVGPNTDCRMPSVYCPAATNADGTWKSKPPLPTIAPGTPWTSASAAPASNGTTNTTEPPATASQPAGASGGGSNTTTVAAAVGSVGAALLLAVAAAAVFAFVRIRRRRRQNELVMSPGKGGPLDTEAFDDPDVLGYTLINQKTQAVRKVAVPCMLDSILDTELGLHMSSMEDRQVASDQLLEKQSGDSKSSSSAAARPRFGSRAYQSSVLANDGSTLTNVSATRGARQMTVGDLNKVLLTLHGDSNATLASARDSDWTSEQLLEQVQKMAANHILFDGKYQLTGEVAGGGQGCVVFATMAPLMSQGIKRIEVAIKFHFNSQAFLNESKLIEVEELEDHLPQLIEISSIDHNVRAPNNRRLPVYMVLPRGEPLDLFICSRRPDALHCVMILIHLAEKLAAMHAAGLVHRDVKPANSIWLPIEHEWNLIDFGCAARIGDDAQILFTPRYAPPEVIQAVADNQKTMKVEAAVDVWALGVIAFELLTGSDELAVMEVQQLWKCLNGAAQLPWERQSHGLDLKVAPAFAAVILQMLSRTPDDRPSMADALMGWRQATGLAA